MPTATMSVAIHNWNTFSDMRLDQEKDLGSDIECSSPSSPIDYDTRDLIPPTVEPGEPEPFIRIQENIVSNKWVFIDFGKMEWKKPEISFTIKTYSHCGRPENAIPVFRIDFVRTDNRLTEYAFQVVRLRQCQRSNEECGFTLHASDRSARSFRAGRQTFIPSDHKLGFRTRCTTHVRKGHFMCDGYRWYQGNTPVSNVFRICGRPGGTKRRGSNHSDAVDELSSNQSRSFLPRAVSVDHTAYFASLSVNQQECDEAPMGLSPTMDRYRHSKSTDFDVNSHHGYGSARRATAAYGGYGGQTLESPHSDLEEMLDMCHDLPQIGGGQSTQGLRGSKTQRGRASSDSTVVLQDALVRMLIDNTLDKGTHPDQQQWGQRASSRMNAAAAELQPSEPYESRDQRLIRQYDQSAIQSECRYTQSWHQQASSPPHDADTLINQNYHPQKRGFPNNKPEGGICYSEWVQQIPRSEGGMPPRSMSTPAGEDLVSWAGVYHHNPYRSSSQQTQTSSLSGGNRAYASPQAQHIAKQRQAYYQRAQSVSTAPYGQPRRNSHHAPMTAAEQTSLWAARRASEGMVLDSFDTEQLVNSSSRFSMDTNNRYQSSAAERSMQSEANVARRQHMAAAENLGHFGFSENAKEPSNLSTLFSAPELNSYLELIIKESTSPSLTANGMNNPHSTHTNGSSNATANFVMAKENPVLSLPGNQFQVGRFM